MPKYCKYCGKEFVQSKNENFCSKSCAGKFNVSKSKEVSVRKTKENKQIYETNPSYCKNCGKELPYDKRHNKFCGKTCAVIYNNSERCRKRETKKEFRVCLNCGKTLMKRQVKFCSIKCQKEYEFNVKVQQVDETGVFPAVKCKFTDINEVDRRFVRHYLEYKYGHKCSICGLTHWLGNPIMLIVDHIDGDIENYKVENYRLVCSNCDATLPTYKNKNRSKGKRRYRRVKQE